MDILEELQKMDPQAREKLVKEMMGDFKPIMPKLDTLKAELKTAIVLHVIGSKPKTSEDTHP